MFGNQKFGAVTVYVGIHLDTWTRARFLSTRVLGPCDRAVVNTTARLAVLLTIAFINVTLSWPPCTSVRRTGSSAIWGSGH